MYVEETRPMYNAELETIQVVPPGREEYAFSYAKPVDWQPIPIPYEAPDFDDPKYFLPVAVSSAMYGVAVFSVGVRPRHAEGTVKEWLETLCREDNVELTDLREVSVGPMRGYMFDARQKAGITAVIMRNLYVEDGGRLFAVCTMAAEPFFHSVEYILAEMSESFRLADPHGPTAPLCPEAPVDAPSALRPLEFHPIPVV